MSKFGNPLQDGAPEWLTPPTRNEPWHGQSAFAALGHVVPMFRRSAADMHLKSMGFDDAERRWDIVGQMSDRIARDNPHGAMEAALNNRVDVTGCYRLLAVLLTAMPDEEPQPTTEATYLDLVGEA